MSGGPRYNTAAIAGGRGLATTNPARNLPRGTARLVRPSHDPKTTPFLERLEDVHAVIAKLEPPLHVAFALGALAGLRPGEAFALRWEHVDLDARRIHVRESVTGTLKDKDSRVVLVTDELLPILTAWREETGGQGLLAPPLRRDGNKIDKGTRGKRLRAVLEELGLAKPGLGWYEATRHTFASQWVLRGGSIEKLKELLGHYSVIVTERYAHLRTDLFTAADHAILSPVRPADGQRRPGGAPNAARHREKGRSRPVSRGLAWLSALVACGRFRPVATGSCDAG